MNTQNNVHVNKVHLIGNLGKDVQINVFESGKKKGSFSLATNESYKNLKGEYITNTTWHNIVLWGVGVEKLEGISKGTKVEVTGRLASRSYTNGDGQRRFITEVNALQVKILESVSVEVPMPVL